MMREIELSSPELDVTCTIELLEDEAPDTVDAIWDELPLESDLLHARHSGDEVLTEMHGEEMIKLDPENWVSNVVPRDVGYWYSHWGEYAQERGKAEFSEIVFIYGRDVKLRGGVDTPAHINLFGQMIDNFEVFADFARRVHTEGTKTIRLEKATE